MDPFQLTEDAILDIDAIWLYLLEKDGVETADRIVTELFRMFSYLVIYEPGNTPLQILAVLHGKRNVARILRQRL